MFNEPQKLQQIIDVNLEIVQVQDLDILLEKILSTARKLVNADGGCIYLKDGEELQCCHVQNDTLQKQLPPEKKLTCTKPSVSVNHTSILGYVADTGEILNIPDVSQLSDDVPYSFDSCYDATFHYHPQSLLAVPLKYYQDETVGVIYLMNAHNEAGEVIPFSEDDIPIIKIFANHVAISLERAQTARIRIQGMIRLLTELHDPEESEAHVNRVGAYSAEIYRVWAHRKEIPQTKITTDMETLRTAAVLHDLGKVAIPQNIRQKPDKLTTEEYEIMKRHTVKGAQMLLKSSQSEYEDAAVQIVLNHHEHWDGTGYPGHINPLTNQAIPGYEDEQGKPRGKKGEEIPVFGRIVAIADVYDALLCRRIYRKPLQETEVLRILEKEAGKRFDFEMVEAFFFCLDRIHAIAQRFPDETLY
jgi:putative nucleotidyltransferase with HDIG domain